jgi:hypothetical protein
VSVGADVAVGTGVSVEGGSVAVGVVDGSAVAVPVACGVASAAVITAVAMLVGAASVAAITSGTLVGSGLCREEDAHTPAPPPTSTITPATSAQRRQAGGGAGAGVFTTTKALVAGIAASAAGANWSGARQNGQASHSARTSWPHCGQCVAVIWAALVRPGLSRSSSLLVIDGASCSGPMIAVGRAASTLSGSASAGF